jgi:uncharacterized protein YegP (UPF0339 family)
MKIIVQQNRRGEWFHHLMAANGKILQHSEAYSSKAKCLQTVLSICKTTGLKYVEKSPQK